MRIGRQVDRHVVDEYRQVGAVVEVPAAQVLLVGLAAVGMGHHRQAGRRFEDFAPGRVTGRALISAPDTVIWLASCGGAAVPPPVFGAPVW